MTELILLDIFSYSCMNCLRSLNFIKRIDDKYKKYGLKTVIVHTPEWNFEKDRKNIINALKKYNIKIPIIIDKNKKIIKKLKINFWPAQLLINNEKILYKHIGEGNYRELENYIIKSLKPKSNKIFRQEPEYSRLPTIYCGKRKNGKIKRLNSTLKFGFIYADENWMQKSECVISLKNNSSLAILTKGKIVNFVAESLHKKPIKVDIKLNNRRIKTISINKPQLYNIIKINNSNKNNKLALRTNKNLAIYSFSFE